MTVTSPKSTRTMSVSRLRSGTSWKVSAVDCCLRSRRRSSSSSTPVMPPTASAAHASAAEPSTMARNATSRCFFTRTLPSRAAAAAPCVDATARRYRVISYTMEAVDQESRRTVPSRSPAAFFTASVTFAAKASPP